MSLLAPYTYGLMAVRSWLVSTPIAIAMAAPEVEVGEGVADTVGVAVRVGVRVGVREGVAVRVGVRVGVREGVAVRVGFAVGLAA
jgi:NF-X1-type zinc finger protein NFXL1